MVRHGNGESPGYGRLGIKMGRYSCRNPGYGNFPGYGDFPGYGNIFATIRRRKQIFFKYIIYTLT